MTTLQSNMEKQLREKVAKSVDEFDPERTGVTAAQLFELFPLDKRFVEHGQKADLQ